MNIHIIGGGNLGVAIAIGISKYTTGNSVTLTRRNIAAIQHLEQQTYLSLAIILSKLIKQILLF
jgi:pyrroline-5-carboxylate reductase